jgi:hypothetical protein
VYNKYNNIFNRKYVMNKILVIFSRLESKNMYYLGKRIILFMMIIFLGSPAFATTYYLSPSGNNSYSSSQAQSQATPWKTFAKAFGAMSGSDTLVLLDGTYSDATGTGYMSYTSGYGGDMPSGTSVSNMTTVRALNEGSVIVSSGSAGTGGEALFMGRSAQKLSYAKVQGIKFIGGGGLYNTSHCYVKNCGFWGVAQTGGAVFGIGTNDGSWGNTYNLIEDCWIWGRDRIIAGNYIGDYNIWRRVVIRGDGCSSDNCGGSGNPNVGFTVYNSVGCSIQNMIIIDRVLDGGTPYADFATAQHSPGSSLGPNEWLGCISMHSPDCASYFEADSANNNTHTVRNFLTIHGYYESLYLAANASDILVENVSSFNTSNGSGLAISSISTGTVRNIVAYNCAEYGTSSSIKPFYIDTYGNGLGAYSQTTPTVGVKTTNPLADGTPASIKYPVRIELGSALKGTGYNGTDYGANIVYKYGIDGTFYGDSGYNALSSNALWPWLNEDRIKSDFASVTNGARGFATGTSRDGSSQTLTKYIWEYLGNTIPDDIYTAVGPSAPTVTGTTPTNNTTPSWSWTSGGGGNGTYRYKMDNSDLSSGATEIIATSYSQGTAFLDRSTHTLYVQERDTEGNWSSSGSFTISIDTTLPILNIDEELTTKNSITISGTSEVGATLYFYINDSIYKQLELSVTSWTVTYGEEGNLTEGDTFEIVAIDKAGNESKPFSYTYHETSNKTEGGGGGGCFIATAAYGSAMESHVMILREFRDLYLMRTSVGRGLIKLYYEYSPALANVIANHGTLKLVTRWGLAPVVGMAYLILHTGEMEKIGIMMLTLGFAIGGCFYMKRWIKKNWE